MKRPIAAIGFSTFLLLSVAARAGAQTLEEGTWTGTMTAPTGQTADVNYAVTYEDGVLAIVLSVPMANMTAPFHDLELKNDTLLFWWEPGVRVECSLARKEDGSFAGDCSDSNGETGHLTMVPPAGQ